MGLLILVVPGVGGADRVEGWDGDLKAVHGQTSKMDPASFFGVSIFSSFIEI